MKSLENFINEQKSKNMSPVKNANKILDEGKCVIYIEKYTMERDHVDFLWMSQIKSLYILEVGDENIGAKYGQSKYDFSSLSGQDLDGDVNDKQCKRIFDEFKSRTGIDVEKESGNPYNGGYAFRSGYFECEYVKDFIKNVDVFDIR